MRKYLAALVAILSLSLPAQASADSGLLKAECAEGYVHVMPFCFTPDELTVYLSGQVDTASPAPIGGSGVERWRPWVEIYFQPQDVDRAMRIMRCESLGDPWAENDSSGAAGLMQHMPRYWAERSTRYGWGGWSIWSPDANIAVAAAMVYHDPRSWLHWVCR